MALKSFQETYQLTNENIDRIAERIAEYLAELDMERSNIVRIRLMMEEALLRWQDHFGPESDVRVSLDVRLRRPTVTLELADSGFDPLTSDDELGMWADSLLSNIGLQPRYSYQRGINTVQLKLKRPRLSPALTLVIGAVLGLLIGVAGTFLLPEAMQNAVLQTVLDPIQEMVFRVLNVVAGPVIFLSVLTAICSVGSVADTGKQGRKLIVRFLLLSLVLTVFSAFLGELAFQPEFSFKPLDGTQFHGVLDFFLQFIPGDALTPLITGDSPQLILVAVLLGYALLSAGNQVGGLIRVLEQANTAALILADWISRIAPIFVALLLILGLWNGSLHVLLGLWQPLLLFGVVAVIFLFLRMFAIRSRLGVPIMKLWTKMQESFLIAFRNASVDAAYGDNQVCCERRLGIHRKLLKYGLPLGLVIYMPAMTAADMLICVYLAKATGTVVSPLWFFMAVLLNVTLLAATPPVAGVGLLTFSVLFTRLNIPIMAITAGMVADILLGFAVSALDQAMLQVELVLEADRLGVLNKTVLQK